MVFTMTSMSLSLKAHKPFFVVLLIFGSPRSDFCISQNHWFMNFNIQTLILLIDYHWYRMELKTWLCVVRILNCLCAAMLVAFQIWFIVDLFGQDRTIYGIMLRIWAPSFIMYIYLYQAFLLSWFCWQSSNTRRV